MLGKTLSEMVREEGCKVREEGRKKQKETEQQLFQAIGAGTIYDEKSKNQIMETLLLRERKELNESTVHLNSSEQEVGAPVRLTTNGPDDEVPQLIKYEEYSRCVPMRTALVTLSLIEGEMNGEKLTYKFMNYNGRYLMLNVLTTDMIKKVRNKDTIYCNCTP